MRVLAFEQFGAGPWATMHLADMGAEIVKIEDPRSGGDVARYVPPYTSERDSLYFQSFNRNKKSVTLDLRRPGAKDVLRRLVRASDAVFNNLRGDLPAKLGLDYAALGPVKPSIVCCSLSAFDRRSSKAHEPGYDYIMQAYAGWMSLTGEPDATPQKSGLSMVDYSAGVLAALGMISAILGARETGRGCDVDVNLFDSALAHLAYLATWHLTAGYEPRRLPDSSHPSQVPSQVLSTSDGWMVVMCAKEKFYRSLVRIMGAPRLADDARFATFEARMENRDALSAALKKLSRTRTTAEWLEALRGEVPCAPVNTVAQAVLEDQVAEGEMVLEMHHPSLGTVRQIGSPIRVSGATPPARIGPALGEHTDQVLRDYAGAIDDEIAAWRKAGVV